MLLCSSDVDFFRGTLGGQRGDEDEDYENDNFFQPKSTEVPQSRSRAAKPVSYEHDEGGKYSYRRSNDPSKDPYFRDWVSSELWGR